MATSKLPTQTTVSKLPKIKDTINLSNQGIIFKDHAALQSIYKQSGPLADSCEFQVHNWNLVFRHKAPDSSYLDIAIPLVYFNYKQEVTGAHIDFEMSEVSEISEKLLPIAQIEANKILSTDFLKALQALFNVEFTTMLTALNSIHKHPGSSKHQSFSGTDLDKTTEEHGVVYPIKTATNDVPNFAGIMALDAKVNNTAHYEYRLVNGELGKDIHYQQGRCIAITVKEPNQSIIEKMLGYEQEIDIKTSYAIQYAEQHPKVLKYLHDLYLKLNYSPFIQTVRPENLTRAAIQYKQPTYYRYQGAQSLFTPPKVENHIKIYEEAELKTMNLKDLKAAHRVIEEAYYECPVNSDVVESFSRQDLIDDIIDLQLNYLAELPITREEMITSLVKQGFQKSTLITKTNQEIEFLYNFEG